MKSTSSQDFENRLKQICNMFDYNFTDHKWLIEALTRQSAITERNEFAASKNYQRLEFLGDTVLNLVISDLICELFPEKKEDDLHPLRSFIVKNDTLGEWGLKLKLGKYLIVGKGEEFQNIRTNKKILADVIEAICGAIFMDSNRNYELTKYLILNFLKPVILKDKIYSEYARELNKFFNNIKRPALNVKYTQLKPTESLDISYEDSNFTDILKENTTVLNLKQVAATNPNKEIKQMSNSIDMHTMVDLFTCKSNTEEKINDIFKINQNNYLIDFDLVYVNSNENYLSLVKKNLGTTEIVVTCLIEKIQFSYENLEVKDHFFASNFLLNLIVNLENISDFYYKSVYCLLHNGIAEYLRRNYSLSLIYLDKVLETIKFVNEREESETILDLKYLCITYISEIAFTSKDLDRHNQCIKEIKSVNNMSHIFRIMQFQKIFVKNLILTRQDTKIYSEQNLNEINQNIDKFCKQVSNLSDDVKTTKLFLEDYIDMRIIRYQLNTSVKDLTEFKDYEDSVMIKCGKESHLYINIYLLYIDKLNNEYEAKKNFVSLEKMAFYYQKVMKIILTNFTLNSRILADLLPKYTTILDRYTNFN